MYYAKSTPIKRHVKVKGEANPYLGLPSRDHKEITVDPKLYDGYIGSYQMNDFRITFAREDDRLFEQLNGQKIQIFPESVRDYFFEIFDAQITFVADGNGRATGLILHEGVPILT
jgi:hypothetical protein